MATRKYVWVKCCICDGTGQVQGINRTRNNGYTTWEPFDDECTNCMGDKGHRVPVYAPDPEPKRTQSQIEHPEWWTNA